MSCAKFVEYKVQGSGEPYVFTYRRFLVYHWGMGGGWEFPSGPTAEVAQLLPMSWIGLANQWSYAQGPQPGPSTAHDYTSAITRELGGNPWVPKKDNNFHDPPYALSELWIWTVDGWCLQAEQRNWK